MKLAKSILCGASALTLAVGSAFASDGGIAEHGTDSLTRMNELHYDEFSTGGSSQTSQPFHYYEQENLVVLEPVEVSYVDVYDVDVDGDGRIDGQLLLEQLDTLAMSPESDELETPTGG